MKNLPQKIYLQIDADGETPEDFDGLEVTWCADKIHDNDIEYHLPQPQDAQPGTWTHMFTSEESFLQFLKWKREQDAQPRVDLVWKAFYLSVCDLPEDEQMIHWNEFKIQNNITAQPRMFTESQMEGFAEWASCYDYKFVGRHTWRCHTGHSKYTSELLNLYIKQTT